MSVAGFTPVTTATPLAPSGSPVTATGLVGTIVGVFNTDTANTAFCAPGSSATTSSAVVPPLGVLWFANSGSVTCTGNSTGVNVVSGTGFPAGFGGGGGGSGSGGGPVTAAVGAYVSGSIVDMGPYGSAFDSLPTPTGTVNELNALVSIYEAILNPGKITGNIGGVMDAIVGGTLPANVLQAGVNTGGVAAAQHICGSQATVHITSATDTQIVAASGSKNIYVCDYEFSFGSGGNFYLEKATTGTCATLTQIAQTWYGATNVGKTAANPMYRGLNTGASAQLCAHTTSGLTLLDVTVYYDQY